MADNTLKAKIQVDAPGVVQTFKVVTDEAGKLQTSLTKLSNTGLSPLAGQFKLNTDSQKAFAVGIRSSVAPLGAATDRLQMMQKASNQSTLALSNLSRVAQDAPYGFLGIANNINPLLESFQRLQATTGSTGGALKAMAKSLGGAGGLGLAVGVVSSLLVVFGDKLFGSKKAAEENTEALDKLNAELKLSKRGFEELEAAIDSANTKGKINLEINFGTGLKTDILDLQGQVLGLDAEILSLEETLSGLNKRKAALGLEINLETNEDAAKKLKEQLTALETAYDEGYQKLTQKLRSRSVNFRQQELTNIREQRRLDEEAAEISNAANERQRRLLEDKYKILEEYRVRFAGIRLGLPEIDFTKLPKDLELANKLMKEGLQELFNVREDAFKLNTKGVTDNLRKALEVEFDKIGKFGGTAFTIPVQTNLEPQIQVSRVQENLKKALDFFQVQVGQTQLDLAVQLNLKPAGNPVLTEMQLAAQAALERLANELNTITSEALSGVFNGVGQALGAAFAGEGDGMQKAFKGIINIIGEGLIQIGNALIKFGIVKAGLQEALKNIALPAGVIIAGGVLAIALGNLVKQSQLPGFATGGVVPPGYPGDSYVARLSSGEKIIPAGQSTGGGERLITSISGTQLRVLLQRTDKSLGKTT